MTEPKLKLQDLREQFERAKRELNLSQLSEEIIDLEEEVKKEDLWQDQEKAQRVLKELKFKKLKRENWEKLEKELQDLATLGDTLEIEGFLKDLEVKFKKLNWETFLTGKYDHLNALMSFSAGVGGDDAEDWATMLVRMYNRFFEKKGWITTIIEEQRTEPGIKSLILEVEGENAYGLLKKEKGVHRLVRLSPFKTADSRQTSFVLVEVMPIFHDNQEVEVKPEDLRVDTFRSSGPGGQHVNKTDSAIRLTHLPTGLVVTCQKERSQLRNREIALKVLKARLWEKMMVERAKKEKELRGEFVEAGWGHQIRSYVLHPYKQIKDLRTEVTRSDVENVLDGDLGEFIEAEIRI
ncbi:peptide chain release factor 2 [Candidatus Peregrinibacteria bacterium CG1_02_41_10]|nr:MAG: peptide chain release factor 2 [Candidatus Peregrinibacteria bacterium CG1_02_41_10]